MVNDLNNTINDSGELFVYFYCDFERSGPRVLLKSCVPFLRS